MAEVSVYQVRSPLAETTNRANATYPASDQQGHKTRYNNYNNDQSDIPQQHVHQVPYDPHYDPYAQPVPKRQNALKASEAEDEAKRFSQASYASTSSSSSRKNYKTHIGPWQLGRTLGKGSSARVRLCRHSVTGQMAAVKIVNRRMAYLVQDSSLAALSKWDSSLPEVNGEMRVPVAIEREVAILKLIEHPNIMKLYDIWENRSEIYLILEYIDQGDLFTFINSKGRLSEEVAIYFFRQMISAIAYCHSFNVCHRDLKPENILITADLQIKIADFGMAALHQTSNHRLATACGSPHYAAPELLKNRQYRGDKADIWSMGVILYAMLSATLPFDDPDIRVMMNKTKKGHYEMPKFLSPDAEDLIRRMLQVNPDNRITMKEIWQHKLIQKYSYIDDFGQNTGQPPDTRNGFQYTPIQPHDVDPQLLRQLRSLWHTFSDDDLETKLASEEPNDQKAFYWLLKNYREQQLEDFKPELSHSMSDYHHLKPTIWKKRVSTCEFTQPRVNGHGRSVSRFTVISTATETEAGTVQSYDPYRGSRMLRSSGSQASHARVTVHRDGQAGEQVTPRKRSASTTTRRRRASSCRTLANTRPPSARGSVGSLNGNRHSMPHIPGPSLRHKRGVDFSHISKRTNSAAKIQQARSISKSSVVVANGSSKVPRPRSPTPEMQMLPDGTYPKAMGAPVKNNASLMFSEELRHFSDNIAKDCDDAFKSSLIEDASCAGSFTDGDRKQRDSTPLSFSIETPSDTTIPTEFSTKSWSSRPLPPLPSDDGGKSPPTTAGNSRPVSRDDDGELSDTTAIQGNLLALPVLLPKQGDRRVVSDPGYTQIHRRPSALPSINENGGMYAEKPRIVSAPPHPVPKKVNQYKSSVEYLSQVENSIRLVPSPSTEDLVKIPKPLNLRKKTTKEEVGRALHRQLAYNAEEDEDEQAHDVSLNTVIHSSVKKKMSWFKRSLKLEDESTLTEPNDQKQRYYAKETIQSSSNSTTSGAMKKRNFSFPFWKSNRSRDSKMMIEGDSYLPGHPDPTLMPPDQAVNDQQTATKVGKKRPGWHQSSSTGSRNIEVKQNWLTRLFRVKPATSYICMNVSRKKARQEVALLLREWRNYGIRGVQVDKERGIIFARVKARNYLNLKEVAFAAEVMTVIEHGKKKPLSIVRFTQERGAASSFHKVVDTMKIVFGDRNLMVEDRNKQKMMIKTLNS